MTRRSPEIEAIVRRFALSVRTHEVADLPHYLSHADETLYVGTAEGETWRGQTLRRGISSHLAEVPDFEEEEVEVEGWENGDVGWAFRLCRFHFPATGARGTHRVTFVFVMERGGWKIVQHHISETASNVRKIGIEHRAFRDLIEAAQIDTDIADFAGLSSILFTDIVGSTALAEALGDARWTGIARRHIETVAAIVDDHGGTLVKSLGDGTMSRFASTGAALKAAIALQQTVAADSAEPRIALRAGIHTGDVIASGDDFFGTVVNKAARVAGLAEPGEILVSDAARLMVGAAPEFRFSAPTRVELRGLEGSHEIHLLNWRP